MAKEGGETAALAEQQSDVVNFVDAAISDVAASGGVSSKRISAPVVSEIAPGSQAAVPMVSASASEAAETRVSSKRMPAPMVPAAAPEIEALENRGEAAVVENLQRDTVRMMSICASAADGAEATVTRAEIEALAQDIASTLKRSGRESRGASQRSSAGDAAADAAGLYLPALTRNLAPQLDAFHAAEEAGATL